MKVDVFITTKNRPALLERSLSSYIKNIDLKLARTTLILDGGFYDKKTIQVADMFRGQIDHILWHNENMGLGPSINQALSHIDSLNKWYESSPLEEDRAKASQFVCYCQDDLLYSEGWLEKLSKMFLLFEQQKKLGFASGIECVEHETKEKGPNGILFKNWIRAANMFARREYWMSMFPIPALDPETGRKRAKPNDGVGSGVDWWFIRNHENSVDRTGKTCLVMPGLLQHLGYNYSTWLGRELPESDGDKEKIVQHYVDEHIEG